MQTKYFSFLPGITIASVLFFSCQTNNKENQPIRIGWQAPLATQGQVVEVMKNSNLLAQQGIKGEFNSFSYGGPQSEAALAGKLDIIFTGDQPIVNLLSKGGKWKIVSRLFYTRTAVMVPLNSDIKTMGQFKGKTIACPFGSVAQRESILKEQAAGIEPAKDVTNLNVDILEISNIVQAGGDKSWGNIDGITVWEPSTSLFEAKKLARIIDTTITLGVVAISEDFITKHPTETTKFLVSLIQSWDYFATHQDEANKWYLKDTHFSYSPQILKQASAVDPNINAKSIGDIDLYLTQNHINTLKVAAQWD